MSRFRIRSSGRELTLPEGEFSVGRSSSCDPTIEDELVSRKHATFRVLGAHVTVEDLGSRNGVLVNGTRIVGRVRVHAGDRVTLGSQEYVLVETGPSPRDRLRTVPSERSEADVDTEDEDLGDGFDEEPSGVLGSISIDGDVDTRTMASTFGLLGAVCERAVAGGDVAEASRMVRGLFGALRRHLAQGGGVGDDDADAAVSYALLLAERTRSSEWLEEIFALSEARSALPDPEALGAIVDSRGSQRLRRAGVPGLAPRVAAVEERDVRSRRVRGAAQAARARADPGLPVMGGWRRRRAGGVRRCYSTVACPS